MKLIDDFSFYIGLEEMQFGRSKTLLKGQKKCFKRLRTINIGFSFTQQVQVRSIDDLYFHTMTDLTIIGKKAKTVSDLYKCREINKLSERNEQKIVDSVH